MEKRKQSNHIRNPHEKKDKLKASEMSEGERIYTTYCVACHAKNGKGDGQRFPPIVNSEYVSGDKTRLINIILNGLNEEITVKGRKYNAMMPSHSFLSNRDIAAVLSYIRTNFNNKSSGNCTC